MKSVNASVLFHSSVVCITSGIVVYDVHVCIISKYASTYFRIDMVPSITNVWGYDKIFVHLLVLLLTLLFKPT